MMTSCSKNPRESECRRAQANALECSRPTPPRATRRAAFTVIELLMVVMVITILYGILLSVIRTVQRHTLQTVTRGELKNIENAWKQYFAHYQIWPAKKEGQESDIHRIDQEMAEGLQGITNNAWAEHWNPHGIAFMEFSRFDADADRRPLNAWGESGRHDKDMCSYYVMFDHDGDNRLLDTEVGNLPDGLPIPFTNELFRGVAVWTYNPEVKDEATDKPVVLGSWQQ
jgi:type II secretory pathway pseudopilin PulG